LIALVVSPSQLLVSHAIYFFTVRLICSWHWAHKPAFGFQTVCDKHWWRKEWRITFILIERLEIYLTGMAEWNDTTQKAQLLNRVIVYQFAAVVLATRMWGVVVIVVLVMILLLWTVDVTYKTTHPKYSKPTKVWRFHTFIYTII
jgi:hypothetical protein